ncbi:hypothetical protein S83_036995 [Arachis hypogaea]|nr:uncharacterized protein DS421_11g348770 [Arachis hypogaea]
MAKSIYGMSMDGDEPPHKGDNSNNNSIGLKNSLSSSSVMIPIPIIDVSLLSSSEPESEKLRSALTSAGCFQAIGHGMSTSQNTPSFKAIFPTSSLGKTKIFTTC